MAGAAGTAVLGCGRVGYDSAWVANDGATEVQVDDAPIDAAKDSPTGAISDGPASGDLGPDIPGSPDIRVGADHGVLKTG
jgi:hypothetical protein